jgi:Cu(I)/Ag(I) efflux system membrane protein CusA/SilA
LQKLLRLGWPDHQSTEELIYGAGGLNERLQLPGVVNAWTMPIKARVDMLTTGVRTPVGIKVQGADLNQIQAIGQHIELALKDVRGTTSVFAERTAGGYFLDFNLKREELARYGLTIEQANQVIMSAVGGEGVTTTIEGRERYPVNVRYLRDYRGSLDRLGRTLVPTMNGAQQIPLEQIADLKLLSGPGMIRDENGRLSDYVYVDVGGRDIGGYVDEAKRVVQQKVQLPPGYTLVWSGQYENMLRVAEKLKIVLPITLFFIFLLMYLNTKSAAYTLIVLGSLPFSAAGAMWMLYLLDYNLNVAVWVGLIAFLGVDAETSVLMLLYLDLAYNERKEQGLMQTKAHLREAILQSAVQRLRPKFMTVAVDMFGLLPVMLAVGAGADLTKRIAAPMIAGMGFSFALELLVYPAIYALWKWQAEVKRQPTPAVT